MKEKKSVWTLGNILKAIGFLILAGIIGWFYLAILYPALSTIK